jgi:hypothetical protein
MAPPAAAVGGSRVAAQREVSVLAMVAGLRSLFWKKALLIEPKMPFFGEEMVWGAWGAAINNDVEIELVRN